MTRNSIISTFVLPLALVGLGACDEPDGGATALTYDEGDTEAPIDVESQAAAHAAAATATKPNLRVAFIGDQGRGSSALAVLDLIKSEGVDFFVIAGDFDYNDNPTAWDEQITSTFGSQYPIFATVGNHDKDKFSGSNGYQSKIIKRMQNAIADGATCTGDPGRNSACTYKGLFLAMSGVGTLDSKTASADYLRDQLSKSDALWSVCVWHKNMNDMQPGGKSNDTGWGVYQACQDEGAIIVTGHEHSYSRTLTLTDLGNANNGHGATGDPGLMVVGKGSTYVTVSGAGGRSLRDYHANEHDDDTWWATIYTTNFYLKSLQIIKSWTMRPGALFIDFNVDGDPNKAHAYFKNIAGEIVDEYDIVREGSEGHVDDGDCDDGEPGEGEVEVLVLTAFEDSYVHAGSPNKNYGAATRLLIDGSPVREVYIKPESLGALANGATIEKATLRLYAYDAGATTEARKITQSWSEKTVTYNNRPSSSAAFTSFSTPIGWVEIDVTSVVQGWANGQAMHGLHLRSSGSNGSDYHSSESDTKPPELVIQYSL